MKINSFVFIILGAVLLIGLFFILSSIFKPKTPQTENAPPQTLITASQEPSGNIKTFELIIEGKKLVSGPTTIKVNQDDEVSIKITSDKEEELHIHAYDNSVELKPNEQTTLTFIAKMSGRFPFELELSKTELGAIEVQPK